jgi:hypothetical protein
MVADTTAKVPKLKIQLGVWSGPIRDLYNDTTPKQTEAKIHAGMYQRTSGFFSLVIKDQFS